MAHFLVCFTAASIQVQNTCFVVTNETTFCFYWDSKWYVYE